MKGRAYIDLGSIFDEIFDAARNIQDELHGNFDHYRNGFSAGDPLGRTYFDENTDFYPNYAYPPMNIYLSEDRSLGFEFALAGFDEKNISLSFQGDYMIFSASLPTAARSAFGKPEGAAVFQQEGGGENLRYLKRRLKMRDIEKQKYYVPQDKYAQEKVKAVFKNGVLKVTVPPREEPEQNEGIKIPIVTEDN